MVNLITFVQRFYNEFDRRIEMERNVTGYNAWNRRTVKKGVHYRLYWL
jgi:hypothetical protein